MKKILTVITVTLALSGCASLDSGLKSVGDFMDSIAPAQNAISESANQICTEYNKNPIVAKEKYENKIIETTGKLLIHADNDLLKKTTNSISVNDKYGNAIFGTYNVNSKFRNMIKSMNNGQTVTIKTKITSLDSVYKQCFIHGDLISLN